MDDRQQDDTPCAHVYCKLCGSPMHSRVPGDDTVTRNVCTDCGFVGYENPKLLVACLLYEKNRLLWIRRAIEPYKGCWALPAGFMECGETVSETACRELNEETGLRAHPNELRLYSILSLPEISQVYVSLIGRLPSHDYFPTPEAFEVALLDRREVECLSLGYPPQTLPLIMQVYDFIESNDSDRAFGRIYDLRGENS